MAFTTSQVCVYKLLMAHNNSGTCSTLQIGGPWLCICQRQYEKIIITYTHPFNGPFSGTTWVSRYQKGKINLDFTEARDSEWQWHQLGRMQVCTSIPMPAPNHSVLYRPDALPATKPTASQHWRHNWSNSMQRKQSYNANVMLQLLVTQIRLRRLILNGGQLGHKPAKCPPQRSLKQMTDCANVSSPTSQKNLEVQTSYWNNLFAWHQKQLQLTQQRQTSTSNINTQVKLY